MNKLITAYLIFVYLDTSVSFCQTKPVYEQVPLTDIQPQGWLVQQLKIMSAGSTGHLDEIYDKIKNDNGWLGGKGDGWEETPYWLDGATPLAYLLREKSYKKRY
jgi:hypothetical protein